MINVRLSIAEIAEAPETTATFKGRRTSSPSNGISPDASAATVAGALR